MELKLVMLSQCGFFSSRALFGFRTNTASIHFGPAATAKKLFRLAARSASHFSALSRFPIPDQK
jgi:hypothetical protein